jgi:hypothetical protein
MRSLLKYFRLRCVMSWKKERDLLIAQTMSFVQSVTGKKPDVGLAEAAPGIAPTREANPAPVSAVEILAAEIIAPPQAGSQVNSRIPRSNVSNDIRSEMQARVANFRAHQQRFHREREEYCSATLTKLRAAIANAPTPGRP